MPKILTYHGTQKSTHTVAGTADQITYALDGAPSSFFVQAATGVVFGAFEKTGSYKFSLVAIDSAGKTAVVEELSFKVVLATTLQLALIGNNQRTFSGDEYTDPVTTKEYIVGKVYKVAPLTVDTDKTTATAGGCCSDHVRSGWSICFLFCASSGRCHLRDARRAARSRLRL